MRIGHYMRGIDSPGGIATYIFLIVQAQLAEGHQVFLFDTSPMTLDLVGKSFLRVVLNDEDLYEQAILCNLDILHLHCSISKLPPPNLKIIFTIHVHYPYCPSGSRYLENWHTPCDRPYGLVSCLWGHFVDKCGSIRPQNLWREFEGFWKNMAIMKQFPVIANSKFVREQMILSGYDSSLIDVLYYPAPEVQDYSPLPLTDVPNFLFLGRICPQKGWDWLLKALARVDTPVHLDIAGIGNHQQEKLLRTLVDNLNLTDKVTTHGWVDRAGVMQLLKKARALVFPSLWHEPAGYVSLEAAVVGRAIIASKLGGIPEYVGLLHNALLVEPNNVQGLADSIGKLAKDWHLAEKMGLTGLEMVENYFAMKEHINCLTGLYERAIQREV